MCENCMKFKEQIKELEIEILSFNNKENVNLKNNFFNFNNNKNFNENNSSSQFPLLSEFKLNWEFLAESLMYETFEDILNFYHYSNLNKIIKTIVIEIYNFSKNFIINKTIKIMNFLNINENLISRENFYIQIKFLFIHYFNSIFYLNDSDKKILINEINNKLINFNFKFDKLINFNELHP